MNTEEKLALIQRHLKAEGAGDVEGACAVYTDSVEHDAVGFPVRRASGSRPPGASTPTSPRTSALPARSRCTGS